MANSNLEPMPFRRQFGGGGCGTIEAGVKSGTRTLTDLAAAIPPPVSDDSFVDASGVAVVKPVVTGACRKCGYPGHLPFQCWNFIQLKPDQASVIDVSSTTSESEEDTPLVKQKKLKHKHKKKSDKKKKHKKKDKKKDKKLKKKRCSSSESDQSRSTHSKKKRKRKLSDSSSSENIRRTKKKEKKRRRYSSESTGSSSD